MAYYTSNGIKRHSRMDRIQLPGLDWQVPNTHRGLAPPATVLSVSLAVKAKSK